ncbi:MAG: TetR/AcrR family transcriptional regulator [Bacteroidales bacterium]|jgi:AcrR family transcriptional regulator
MNETKEHILKTSLLLFLQKSYKEVTMKEIVEKTGMSKGAFYHYFVSKEDLYREIVLLFFSMGTIDYDEFPPDSLNGFYKRYLEYIDGSFKKLYGLVDSQEEETVSLNLFLILFEAVSRFPEFLELEQKEYNNALKAWTKVISQAKVNGEIRSQTSDTDIAELFLYCTDGVFIRYLNSNSKKSYSRKLSVAFDALYANLKT